MNNISRLIDLAAKKSRYYIALCKIEGQGYTTQCELERFITKPYTEEFKNQIRSVFADPKGNTEELCMLDQSIANHHGELVLDALEKWGMKASAIDVIASHGQTVYHAPRHQSNERFDTTLQLGDGDFVAAQTGILTVSDFRQKHIAAGGEGAPLALYGDELLFSSSTEDRILINIGGIANFTYLPRLQSASARSKPFSTDTGPGNTIMDAFVQLKYNIPYDKDGLLANQGKLHDGLLDLLMKNSFFKLPVPKTTGPEVFNLSYLNKILLKLSPDKPSNDDILATLCTFSAFSISQTIKPYLTKETNVYLSGGGARNPLLVKLLRSFLPDTNIGFSNDIGISIDAKEAVLFAVLANELLFGNPQSYRDLEGDMPKCVMGKISFP